MKSATIHRYSFQEIDKENEWWALTVNIQINVLFDIHYAIKTSGDINSVSGRLALLINNNKRASEYTNIKKWIFLQITYILVLTLWYYVIILKTQNSLYMYLIWSVDLLQLVCNNYTVNISKLVCNICRQISQKL